MPRLAVVEADRCRVPEAVEVEASEPSAPVEAQRPSMKLSRLIGVSPALRRSRRIG